MNDREKIVELVNKELREYKPLKRYDELNEGQQKTARKLFPEDYREGVYHFNCYAFDFRAK